jgi:hypothetical protein
MSPDKKADKAKSGSDKAAPKEDAKKAADKKKK